MTNAPEIHIRPFLTPPRIFGAEVLRTEAAALSLMAETLSDEFDQAVQAILACRGRVIVSGMGKSGHVARKIAATLASTGTPAFFVHPAEASHGDLGMITQEDVCILLSNSGETLELHDLVSYARRFSIPLIGVSKCAGSTLIQQSDIALILPDAPEACAIGMAPTTSTTCSLALGDALAVALMRIRGFERDAFHAFHPGGKLGSQFLSVSALMHKGTALPKVTTQTPMGDVIVEMSCKGFGVAAVLEGYRLVGSITDGDLRRHLVGLMDYAAGDVATLAPRTITPGALASEALAVMNQYSIGALFVVDDEGRLIGLIRIHDCLRAGIA
jgi:arabinose-5-phosphate isomerase